MPTLTEVEEEQQRVLFVGREDECLLFRQALEASGPRAFYVHGPGGVGKTSLLQMFAREAQGRSVPSTWIDARDLDLTLLGVIDAFERAGLSTEKSASNVLRRVVLIDAYEYLRCIEPLVIRELFHRLHGDTVVVIAGRLRPSAEWCSRSVWRSVIAPIPLRNLQSADAKKYLSRRGIRGQAIETIQAFSHGHPLALALAADAWRHTPDRPFASENAPHVVTALYDYFVCGLSNPEQRSALEITAVLRTTSEEMLGTMLEGDAKSTFEWLRQLSFMQIASRGVFPHDLAREVILADLRWRNRERLAALVGRALRHYIGLIETYTGSELAQSLAEFAFVHGNHPRLRVLMVDPDLDLAADDLRSEDHLTIESAVLRHEGPTSLGYLRHWLLHQPSAFKVVRNAEGTVVAFGAWIRFDMTTEQTRAGDPVVVAAWDHMVGLLDGAPREPSHYVRFVMACDTGQAPSPAMAVCWQISTVMLWHFERTIIFNRLYEGRTWEFLATISGASFVPELQHEMDGRTYEVTIQDLRNLSRANWLASLISRSLRCEWHEPKPAQFDDSSLAAINRDEFVAHVRKALRALHDLTALADNPLIHSQAVRTRLMPGTPPQQRAPALQALLMEEVEALRGKLRDDTLYGVLSAAYLNPVGKHESAARELGITYSTFRRRLSEATELLSAALWERELS